MARIRTVKPDYWGDPKTARLTLPARLLFIGLLTEADDEGRFLASGKKLAGSLFPNDDDVTPKKVCGWLAELEHVGFVCRYTAEGVEYAHIPAFTTHQKISHPTDSRLPDPEEYPNGSGTAPESFCPDLGTGNKEQGVGDASAPSRKKPKTAIPAEFTVAPEMIEWAQREYPSVNWDAESRKFVTSAKANDRRYADWPQAWKNWIQRAAEGFR